MKNIASILVIVLAFSFTTQAQGKRNQLSATQQANLKVKRITLALDLSNQQQSLIRPLLMAQITEKEALMRERKETRKAKRKPTADEIYAKKSKVLDDKIAMKNSMKKILNETQFKKFEKMRKSRKMKGKRRMLTAQRATKKRNRR